MATHQVLNNAKTRLTYVITSSETSLTVGDGSLLPATPFWLTVWNDANYGDPGDDPGMEVMECTNKAGNVLTVVRAQSGTVAADHAAASRVAALVMAEHMDEKFSLDAGNSPITGVTRTTGDGLSWEDIRFPATSAVIGASAPDLETFQGTVKAYAFDKNQDEEMYFTVQVPHGWAVETELRPHIHWAPSDTDTGSVTWKLEYTLAEIDGTFGATSTLDVTQAGDGVAHKHQYAALAAIDMSGITSVSPTLMCRIYRDVSDGDDYAADAFLLEIDFHYQNDGWGSDQELSKT
jgi:hypothetical protein